MTAWAGAVTREAGDALLRTGLALLRLADRLDPPRLPDCELLPPYGGTLPAAVPGRVSALRLIVPAQRGDL